MIIVMQQGAPREQVEAVVNRVEEQGYKVHLSRGEARTIIGIIGADEHLLAKRAFDAMDGVEKTMRVMEPYKMASRSFTGKNTVINANGVQIGGQKIVVMAGPCSVESREQILETAHAVHEAGATVLRGGAFKPRSSPYSFQGLGEEGLKYMAEAREQTGLAIITEVMSTDDLELVCEYADILQIGARNAQNYSLLKALGAVDKPVFLKRGISGTVEELLMSAEYVLERRQHERDALRARHPHLRDGYAQHLRHQRDSRAQAAVAPARRRRPGPRHGQSGLCHAGRARRRRRRGGCADDRGSSAADQSLERRRAEPDL